MSEEDAKAFLKKVRECKEFLGKLKGADTEEKFFAFGKEVGFAFTNEKWLAVYKNNEGDLGEGDLGAAMGRANAGWWRRWIYPSTFSPRFCRS